MPIPDFDHNLVLPPHLGDPRNAADLSPYPCTTLELVDRFATSVERRTILTGLMDFRESVRGAGISRGFQWLDGSFLEDIENGPRARAPGDLDLVTVFWGYDRSFQRTVASSLPEFASRALAKARYRLDHFPFDADAGPQLTVETARYWIQLFSHDRNSVWKGMLKIDLDTPDLDNQAREVLAPPAP